MFAAIARRISLSFLILILVSLFVFLATEVLPGDALDVSLTDDDLAVLTPEQLAEMRAELGLDRPAAVRYLSWLSGALVGDFGNTIITRAPVADIIMGPLRNSILLALATTAVAIPVAHFIGILAAYWRDRAPDTIVSTSAIVGYSIPEFVSGNALILIFAIWLPIFPATIVLYTDGPILEMLAVSILPVATIVIGSIAYLSRLLRLGLVEALVSDYVERARLAGVSEWRVVFTHAVPASLVPTLNAAALYVAGLLSGIVVVEKVFAYPGLGLELINAVLKREVPVVQATVFLGAVGVLLMNLLADLSIIALDPRVRRSAGRG
ncbi:ABC transporter permease [Shinella granuli]|uniref:Peptide/nickel transport system permease protein n=1 Tax=Shinella granuli TaxID=323621 RepID=A0A4R2C7E3_SHIGR|nr:ABC transporter permease [Shinella granuli]TCN35635.1 peptide/nickel transport system permease protein [Shinella granuli]